VIYRFSKRWVKGLSDGWRNRIFLVLSAIICCVFLSYLTVNGRFAERLFRTLLSPGKSVFLFSPVLVLGFAARSFFSRFRAETLFVVSLFVSYLLVLRSETVWAWGSRYYVALIPFLALPLLGFMAEGFQRWLAGGIAAGILLFSVLVQLLAVSINYHNSLTLADYWASHVTQVMIHGYNEESEHVFPRLLYVPQFSPLVVQIQTLAYVVGREEPPDFRERVPKLTSQSPSEWSIDLWWLRLRPLNISEGTGRLLFSAFALTALICGYFVFSFLRKQRKLPAS